MGWIVFSIILGLIGTYIAIIRPILMARPVARDMIAEADGVWAKIWALCYQSATVVVSYGGIVVGFIMNMLDIAGSMLSDPSFQDQVRSLLGGNPKLLGGVLMAISAIVFAARMRSIIKGA